MRALRWSKPLLVSACVALIFSLTHSTAAAQETSGSAAGSTVLPNAPEPGQATASAANESQNAGTITGTVLDTNGDVLQGAQVSIAVPSGPTIRSVQSGADGQFALPGLSPGMYTLTVTAPGMRNFKSSEIALRAGEFHIVPPITLRVSGGTTHVTVTAKDKQQLAEQQVQIAVHQRIGGVLPNFYSSYDWNAPPMEAKQKFELSFRSIIDPVGFFTIAGLAGAEQYENVFPEYGSGIEGYGKRYGAALANHVSGTLLGKAVYPSIFHQDPRYFYKGKGGILSRTLYAIAATVVARGDNGRWQPNYSQLLGNFSGAALSNLYYPAANRGASLVLVNGLEDTGADAVSNIFREFVLKRITSHVPQGANGEP